MQFHMDSDNFKNAKMKVVTGSESSSLSNNTLSNVSTTEVYEEYEEEEKPKGFFSGLVYEHFGEEIEEAIQMIQELAPQIGLNTDHLTDQLIYDHIIFFGSLALQLKGLDVENPDEEKLAIILFDFLANSGISYEELEANFTNITEVIQEYLSPLAEKTGLEMNLDRDHIKNLYDAFSKKEEKRGEAVTEAILDICPDLADSISAKLRENNIYVTSDLIKKSLPPIFKDASSSITEIKNIIGLFQGNILDMLKAIGKLTDFLDLGITDVGVTIGGTLMLFGGDLLDDTWTSIQAWGNKTINDVKNFGAEVLDWGEQAIQDVKEWGEQAIQDVKDWGEQAIEDVKDWGEQTIEDVTVWGVEAWEDVEDFFSDAGDFLCFWN